MSESTLEWQNMYKCCTVQIPSVKIQAYFLNCVFLPLPLTRIVRIVPSLSLRSDCIFAFKCSRLNKLRVAVRAAAAAAITRLVGIVRIIIVIEWETIQCYAHKAAHTLPFTAAAAAAALCCDEQQRARSHNNHHPNVNGKRKQTFTFATFAVCMHNLMTDPGFGVRVYVG